MSLTTLHRRNSTAVRQCAERCDNRNKHSIVTTETSTALWQQKQAQRCGSENKHSAVTAMVLIVMLQRWQWQRWDSSGSDSADITMFCTLVSLQKQTPHFLRGGPPRKARRKWGVCFWRLDISVTDSDGNWQSVTTTFKAMCTSLSRPLMWISLSQRRLLSPLSQRC